MIKDVFIIVKYIKRVKYFNKIGTTYRCRSKNIKNDR